MELSEDKINADISNIDIMVKAFSIYTTRFVDFAVPFILLGLVGGVVSAITFSNLPVNISVLDYSLVGIRELFIDVVKILLVIIFLASVDWVIYTVLLAMAVKITSDILDKREVNQIKILNEITEILPSILGASLLSSVLIIVGFIALIIPGIYVAVIFNLVIPVVVIERRNTLASLSRSKDLINLRLMKTLGLILLLFLIIVPMTLIVNGVFRLVLPFPFSTIIATLAALILLPIYGIAITISYYSTIERERLTQNINVNNVL